jgi:hypothetical protein
VPDPARFDQTPVEAPLPPVGQLACHAKNASSAIKPVYPLTHGLLAIRKLAITRILFAKVNGDWRIEIGSNAIF